MNTQLHRTAIHRHPALYVGLVVIGVWALYGYVVRNLGYQTAGQWGDSFGYINCLFTGLALVGIVAAYWRDHENARDRESEHRAVLTRMEEQTEAMRQQGAAIANASRAAVITERIRRLQHFLDVEIAKPVQDGWVRQRRAELGGQIEQLNDELDRILGLSPQPKPPEG